MDLDNPLFAAGGGDPLPAPFGPDPGADDASFESVVARAVALVPGCDACGLVVQRPDQAPTIAASDAAAGAVEARQHAVGQGPSLEGPEGGATLLAGDLSTDPRWPLWTPYVVQQGFHSVLSVRLQMEVGAVGALDLYGTAVDAFDDDAVDRAEFFAEHAAAGLDLAGTAIGLRTALRSRYLIGVAQGIVAVRCDLSLEDAFDLLRRMADDSGLQLRDVANLVVVDRGLPEVLRGTVRDPR